MNSINPRRESRVLLLLWTSDNNKQKMMIYLKMEQVGQRMAPTV